MRRPIAIALAGLFAAAALAQQPEVRASVHYAPAENLERMDVALIGRATRTLDIAAYVLTDVPVIHALRDAALRGVSVRLYRDANDTRAAGVVAAALDELAPAGVAIKFKPGRVYMHLKSYAVDRAILRAGAANFSASGLKNQNNDLVIIVDPAQVAAFETMFEGLWSRP